MIVNGIRKMMPACLKDDSAANISNTTEFNISSLMYLA